MQGTDEDLVARALAGRDPAAFGELVRRHQSRIRSWLRQLTRDAARYRTYFPGLEVVSP